MKLKNFKLVIEYDGGRYHGWQRQKSDVTIQGTIEDALRVMMKQPVTVIGSGRTDAGVHALGQVANVKCRTRIAPDELQRGLNSLLPADIVILSAMEADVSFHARYDAKSKAYRYRIRNTQAAAAVGRQYQLHVRKRLDLKNMAAASEYLIGRHDFKTFEGTGSPRTSSVRNVFSAGFAQEKEMICFEIEADGFLKCMVRSIVGTLLEVGLGKMTVQAFRKALVSKERHLAGTTAPAHGLFLKQVNY